MMGVFIFLDTYSTGHRSVHFFQVKKQVVTGFKGRFAIFVTNCIKKSTFIYWESNGKKKGNIFSVLMYS